MATAKKNGGKRNGSNNYKNATLAAILAALCLFATHSQVLAKGVGLVGGVLRLLGKTRQTIQ